MVSLSNHVAKVHVLIRGDLPNGAMFFCCLNSNQSGHWYIKPGRADLLLIGTSETNSKITAGT
jgi:hypothetical protein